MKTEVNPAWKVVGRVGLGELCVLKKSLAMFRLMSLAIIFEVTGE